MPGSQDERAGVHQIVRFRARSPKLLEPRPDVPEPGLLKQPAAQGPPFGQVLACQCLTAIEPCKRELGMRFEHAVLVGGADGLVNFENAGKVTLRLSGVALELVEDEPG